MVCMIDHVVIVSVYQPHRVVTARPGMGSLSSKAPTDSCAHRACVDALLAIMSAYIYTSLYGSAAYLHPHSSYLKHSIGPEALYGAARCQPRRWTHMHNASLNSVLTGFEVWFGTANQQLVEVQDDVFDALAAHGAGGVVRLLELRSAVPAAALVHTAEARSTHTLSHVYTPSRARHSSGWCCA